jgi:flavin-dependent dehydrogenase
MTITIGPRKLSNPMSVDDSFPGTTAPRRIVLDHLLVEAAREAGAEVREQFSVDRLVFDNQTVIGIVGHDRSRGVMELRAPLTIGADGAKSMVARSVGAREYHRRESRGAGFYSYFSHWPAVTLELAFGEAVGVGVVPTNDERVCVFAVAPTERFNAYKRDVEGTHQEIVASVSPRLGDWLAAARREERFYGWAPFPGFFREPFGPGWALVGDAGYHKDMVTAHGITDAFRDAQWLAEAVIAGLGGARPLHEALSHYQARRDEVSIEMYQATQDIAQFDMRPAGIAKAFLRFAAAEQREWAELAASF